MTVTLLYINGLVQERRNSSALAMELPQLAMRRRATSSQRWHPLPRSRSHTQRRANVGSRSQAAQSAT